MNAKKGKKAEHEMGSGARGGMAPMDKEKAMGKEKYPMAKEKHPMDKDKHPMPEMHGAMHGQEKPAGKKKARR